MVDRDRFSLLKKKSTRISHHLKEIRTRLPIDAKSKIKPPPFNQEPPRFLHQENPTYGRKEGLLERAGDEIHERTIDTLSPQWNRCHPTRARKKSAKKQTLFGWSQSQQEDGACHSQSSDALMRQHGNILAERRMNLNWK